MTGRRSLDLAFSSLIALVVGVIFVMQIAGPTVPVLRHDWSWPIERSAFKSFFTDYTSGWINGGVGKPNPYPTSYLLASAQSILGLVLGPVWSLKVYLTGIAFFAFLYAYRTLALLSVWTPFTWRASAILGGLLLLNPWTYAEAVAGHITMILACYALYAIIVEMTWGKSPKLILSGLVILVIAQIQFALLASLFLAYVAFRKNTLPAFTFLSVALPSIVGICFNHTYLLDIPYTLEWQNSQSLDPLEALVFLGYAPGYNVYFHQSALIISILVIQTLAVYGWISDRSHRIIAFIAFLGIWLWTTGTKGLFSTIYSLIITHVHISAVFRELYDLIGCMIILAVMGVALAARRSIALGLLGAFPLVAFACVWIFHAPNSFTVDASVIHHSANDAPFGTRFAVYPAFQPMSYRGKGSGNDPDTFSNERGGTPLNGYSFSYPESSVLALPHDAFGLQQLGALGVSRLIFRRNYTTNNASLRTQIGAWNIGTPTQNTMTLVIHPTPFLQFITTGIPTCLLGRDLRRSCIALDDAGMKRDVIIAKPLDSDDINPQKNWVNISMLSVIAPRLAEGIGGTFTTSSSVLYPVREYHMVYAAVYGSLRGSNGALLSQTTDYTWIHIPSEVQDIVCHGLCVLTYFSRAALPIPESAPAQTMRTIWAHVYTPWLLTAQISAQPHEGIRYAVRFSPYWVALTGFHFLPHVRLNAYANGWDIVHPYSGRLIVIQWVAAIQCVCEIFGACIVLMILVRLCIRKRSGLECGLLMSPPAPPAS